MQPRPTHWIGILFCIFFSTQFSALAAPPPPPAPPRPPGAPAPALPPILPPALSDTVLPDITFDNVSLPDALVQLQQKVPGFHSVIVPIQTNPVDPSTLVLPKFSAKDLTLGQFLDFLQATFVGLQVQVIDGPHAPLYVIHVQAIPGQVVQQPAQEVRVYSLKDIVLSMLNGDFSEKAKKKALDDLLTLMQSAVSRVAEGQSYALSVHEPTMTMLCQGTPKMIATLDQTVSALEPRDAELDMQRQLDAAAKAAQRAQEQVITQSAQLLEKHRQIDELTQKLTEEAVRLETAQKFQPATTRP